MLNHQFELSNTLDPESRQLSYNASLAACDLHKKTNRIADSLNGEVGSDSEDDLAAVISTIASPETKKKRKNLAQRFR